MDMGCVFDGRLGDAGRAVEVVYGWKCRLAGWVVAMMDDIWGRRRWIAEHLCVAGRGDGAVRIGLSCDDGDEDGRIMSTEGQCQ
jgi:hypothetical protein